MVEREAQLDRKVPLQMLRIKAIALVPYHIAWTPQLRTIEMACTSGILHLAELLEWWLSSDMQVDESRQLLADLANRLDDARRRRSSMRGGAPKGRLAWESSHSVQGMRLAFPFKHGEDVLPGIPYDRIFEGYTGVCFILLANWQKVIETTSDKPLVYILPGKCTNILRKLGADMSRAKEDDVLLKDADGTTILGRSVTVLRATQHEVTAAAELQSVDWLPAASVEIIAELNSRWATSVVTAEAERDLKKFLTNCLSKFAMETHQMADVFGCRMAQEEP